MSIDREQCESCPQVLLSRSLRPCQVIQASEVSKFPGRMWQERLQSKQQSAHGFIGAFWELINTFQWTYFFFSLTNERKLDNAGRSKFEAQGAFQCLCFKADKYASCMIISCLRKGLWQWKRRLCYMQCRIPVCASLLISISDRKRESLHCSSPWQEAGLQYCGILASTGVTLR